MGAGPSAGSGEMLSTEVSQSCKNPEGRKPGWKHSPSCCWPLKTTGPALSGPRPQLLAPPVPSLRARRGGQGGPAPSPEPRSAPFSQGRPPACPALLAPPSPESSKFTSPGPPEATSPGAGAGQGHGLRGLPAGVLGSREGARRRW